jgi:Zn-dependent M28 family amino/carboxypeptidase
VATLAGHVEINPGVKLADRSSASNRALARTYLAKELRELGLEPREHAYSSTGTNLLATLPATIETDEYILVGAHYDSVGRSPGANDNATGSAMVLDAARHLASVEPRTKNVIFVFFDEEERGLIGSGALARKLRDEGMNLTGVHTVDQMGWDADGDRAVEIDGAAPEMIEAYRKAVEEGGLRIPIQPITLGSTDHVPFKRLGFKAYALSEEYLSGDTTPHYHRPTDRYETVNWDYLELSSVLLERVLEDQVLPTEPAPSSPSSFEWNGGFVQLGT